MTVDDESRVNYGKDNDLYTMVKCISVYDDKVTKLFF